MYEDLNNRQVQILDFIRKEIKQKGYPPAVREIGEAVGLSSSSTVHSHLHVLEEKGYIRRDPTKPRAIEVLVGQDTTSVKKEMIDVPVIGRVTAGQPILAVENIEDTFPLPMDFVRNDNVFILRIKGESMIEAGILDEDYVLVRRQNTARNGEIVVALIDDEATVKRFFKEKDYFRLQPENQYMDPILVKDVAILGKVIGVFRRIH